MGAKASLSRKRHDNCFDLSKISTRKLTSNGNRSSVCILWPAYSSYNLVSSDFEYSKLAVTSGRKAADPQLMVEDSQAAEKSRDLNTGPAFGDESGPFL
jgi:hypothetical protein